MLVGTLVGIGFQNPPPGDDASWRVSFSAPPDPKTSPPVIEHRVPVYVLSCRANHSLKFPSSLKLTSYNIQNMTKLTQALSWLASTGGSGAPSDLVSPC